MSRCVLSVSKMTDIELVTECSLLNALHHQRMDYRLTRSRLKLRKLHHSFCFKTLFRGSAFLLLFLLPFLEYPSSSPDSNQVPPHKETVANNKYFWLSIVIEWLLLLVLTVYAILRGFIIMPPYNKTALKQYFTSYRLTYYLYILALQISWPLWLASVINCNGENDLFLHIRQFVRPVFLIVQVIMIKKILKAIAYTSMQLIGNVTLLFLVLFIFVMIGLAIFPHEQITNSDIVNEGTTYFNSTREAFWNLLVYLSTANSPDFMTPAYSHNHEYFLYFGTFFFIANFLLLKVAVALYATRFMFFLEESMKRTYTNRLVNLAVVFQALTRKSIFNKTDQIKSDIVKNYAVDELNLVDEEIFDDLCNEHQLDWEKFKTLFLKILTYLPVKDKTFAYFPTFNQCQWQFFCRLSVNIISLPLAVIHVIVLTTFLAIDHKDSLTDQQSNLVTAMLVFSCLYIFELLARLFTLIAENRELYNCSGNWDLRDTICKVMKWFLLGHDLRTFSKVKKFTAFTLTVLDILLLLSVLVLGIITHLELDSLTFFRLVQITITLVILRMFRMVARIPAFAIMFYSLFHIMIVLIPFVVLAYILYYQFAVIGIALFGHTNLTDTTPAAQQYGTYENLNYYPYHFKDFGSTLVLLWNLMIVNNWHIITDAYVRRNSEAARLYFITWWLITETVINGVLFGVLLEILLKTTSEFFKLSEKLKRKNFCNRIFLIFNSYIWWGRSNSKHSNIISSWNVYKVITFDKPEQEMEINQEAIQIANANPELRNLLNNDTVPV